LFLDACLPDEVEISQEDEYLFQFEGKIAIYSKYEFAN
jgi:hypothetical protein